MPETLVASEILSSQARETALELFASTKSGRERPSRYWKIDLEQIGVDGFEITAASSVAEFSGGTGRGVIVCDLATARRDHAAQFEAAFVKALERSPSKFSHLTRAHVSGGAFVFVPDDVAVAEPITVRYTASSGAGFPYTLVVAGKGAQCTVIEELSSERPGVFVAGVAEVIAGENAHVTYASLQTLPADATVVFSRAALPRANATVSWAAAEIGAALSASSIDIAIEERGVTAQVAALFFPDRDQHVDMVSTIDHRTGDTQSDTLVKSAAIGSGQARYLGNIMIQAGAHGTEASLRDDALLLSKKAHIDSVPALEIAANDVKAFHGATVGAIDREQIFYMESRGLERREAEKMIALGFFEPAVARFPGEELRTRIHAALEAKVLGE